MNVNELWLLERQAEICKALGHVKRLQIVYLLQDREMAAGEIAAALDTTAANVSQHLNALKQAGLVASRREGAHILYRIQVPSVLGACAKVRQVLRDYLRAEQAHLAMADDSHRS
jgi:DNA-binding transcriptional ArsR family regulator